MIDFFYVSRDSLIRFIYILHLEKIPKLKGVISKLVSFIINFLYLTKYKTIKNKKMGTLVSKRDEKIIVSLTTFPKRINTVEITIDTLMNQSLKPDYIILWLAEDEFKNKFDDLPKSLLKLQERGLTIKFCENIKPHKKYFYTMKKFPNDIVITVDDDILYPQNLVKELYSLHLKYPTEIICTKGHKIKLDTNKNIKPYREWTKNPNINEEPRIDICPTGVGGVLYPSKSLDSNIFNLSEIKELCINADDLWLKTMSLLKGTKVVKSSKYKNPFFVVRGSDKQTLSKNNVDKNQNDVQMNAILKCYDLKEYL